MGRSSPAVDEIGNVFIGMDQVDPGQAGVPPVLLALDNMGSRMWVNGGVEPGPIWNPIGLRSPIIGYEETGSPATAKIFFARKDVVQAFTAGIMCPTTNPLLTCSGHGACDCNSGTCSCELLDCFYGDDCGTEQTCNENGFCMDGVCVCTDPCFSGPVCDTPNTCSDRGTCGIGGCQCNSACFYGVDCENVRDCSGQGECQLDTGLCKCHAGITGPNCEHQVVNLPGSPGLGGGWVFLIVLLCVIVVVTAAYMIYWKRRTGEWWFYVWRVSDIVGRFSRGGGSGEAQPLTTASPARKGPAPRGGGYTADL